MKLTQKDWLDYINRLQERERQKITSSGINNWILFVAIGALAYLIFPNLPIIIKHSDVLFLYTAIFLNIGNSIFNGFNQEFRVHKIINYRRVGAPILETQCRKIMKFYELLVAILSIVLTTLAIILNPTIRLDILIVLGVTVLAMLTVGLYSVFIRISDKEFQRIESNFSSNEFALFLRYITSISTYVTLYPLIMLVVLYRFNETDLKIALFGFVFMLIILLFQFLIVIFTKRLKIAWLEDFEREIIIFEYDDNEIRDKLKNTYFKLSHIDDYF